MPEQSSKQPCERDCLFKEHLRGLALCSHPCPLWIIRLKRTATSTCSARLRCSGGPEDDLRMTPWSAVNSAESVSLDDTEPSPRGPGRGRAGAGPGPAAAVDAAPRRPRPGPVTARWAGRDATRRTPANLQLLRGQRPRQRLGPSGSPPAGGAGVTPSGDDRHSQRD